MLDVLFWLLHWREVEAHLSRSAAAAGWIGLAGWGCGVQALAAHPVLGILRLLRAAQGVARCYSAQHAAHFGVLQQQLRSAALLGTCTQPQAQQQLYHRLLPNSSPTHTLLACFLPCHCLPSLRLQVSQQEPCARCQPCCTPRSIPLPLPQQEQEQVPQQEQV